MVAPFFLAPAFYHGPQIFNRISNTQTFVQQVLHSSVSYLSVQMPYLLPVLSDSIYSSGRVLAQIAEAASSPSAGITEEAGANGAASQPSQSAGSTSSSQSVSRSLPIQDSNQNNRSIANDSKVLPISEDGAGGGGGVAGAGVKIEVQEKPLDRNEDSSSTVSVDQSVSTYQNKVYSPTHHETQSGTATNAAIVTSAQLSGIDNQLYIASVSIDDNAISVSSITGLGLTWSLILKQCSASGQLGVEIWYALGTVSGNGQVTANLSGTAISSEIVVSRYSRVDTASPIGNSTSGNKHGVSGHCGMPATNSNSYSFTLITSENDSVVYSATSFSKNITHTAVSLAEREEVGAGANPNITNLVVQERVASSPTSYLVDGSFSAASLWAVVAVEIKPSP